MSAARAPAWVLGAFLAGAPAQRAQAQAPINSDVALQPGPGQVILRQQFRFARADFDTDAADLDIRTLTSSTTAVYGLRQDLTLLVSLPAVLSRRVENDATGGSETDAGLADLATLAKFRVYRNDFGPNETARFDLLGGVELPAGDDDFSSESIDPIVGGVGTVTFGRHYFSADAQWKFNTAGGSDGDDLFRYDGAYVYRLRPAEYAAGQTTQLNGVLELNGSYWTDGDDELFLSPGLQYVTRRWIAEATVQVPVRQDLDNRPERGFVVGVSFRVQF